MMNETLNYECIVDETDWITWIITGPVTTIVAVFGVCSNLFSLNILRSLAIRPSIRLYLSVLAIANSFVSFCSIWYYSLAEILKPLFGTISFFQYLTVIMHPVSFLSITVAVWMLLIVTAARYFALAYPLRHRVHDSVERARYVYICILLIAILYSVPTLFEMRLSDACSELLINPPKSNSICIMVLDCSIATLFNCSLYMATNVKGCQITLIETGKYYLSVALSSTVLDHTISTSVFRVALSGRSSNQENTTVMLLVVAVKFLLCNYLMIAVNIWELLAGSKIAVGKLYKFIVELSNLLVVANSASDSIVYLRWRRKPARKSSYSNVFKPLFTSDEATLLKNQFECHVSCDAFIGLLTALQRFKCTILFTNQLNFQPSGRTIGSMLAKLLIPNNEDMVYEEGMHIQSLLEEMVFSIGEPTAEQNIVNKLNCIGSRHANLSIPATKWNQFKNTLVEVILLRLTVFHSDLSFAFNHSQYLRIHLQTHTSLTPSILLLETEINLSTTTTSVNSFL
ncbi:unnamed protein product [Anisakis simplex]|uniref:G_PROTEIN_RECEP_F1_2 domain-containing protein n=1 Tax=Anisakis simplex TaxID=6269 RepID=A0A0M3JUZ1_ANISI|nr:unnamed protein product [Anisakis simplex]